MGFSKDRRFTTKLCTISCEPSTWHFELFIRVSQNTNYRMFAIVRYPFKKRAGIRSRTVKGELLN